MWLSHGEADGEAGEKPGTDVLGMLAVPGLPRDTANLGYLEFGSLH